MLNLFGPPTVEFCEKATGHFIQRPFYALSNLAFIFVSMFIYREGRNKLAKLFAVTIGLVAIFSTIYDSSYTYISQLFDLSGMILFINMLLFLNLKIIFKKSTIMVQLLLSILGVASIFYFKGFSGIIVFGLFVAVYVATETYLLNAVKHINARNWFFAFLIFILAFAVWLLDIKKLFCDPTNILNGRGIFHIMTAVSVYLLYKFYSQQEIEKNS